MGKEKPIGILTSDNKLTDEEKEQLKKEFEEYVKVSTIKFTEKYLNILKLNK